MLLGRLLRRRASKEGLPELAKVPTLHLVDLAVAVAPIGLMCGRLANFVNGELLGKIVAGPAVEGAQHAPWWAVRFPQEILARGRTGEIGDAQIAAAAEAVGMSHFELELEAGQQRFVAAYTRLMEELRGGGPGAETAANFMHGFLNARHPSQLYQAAVEGPLLLAALFIVWMRPRVAGVVTAWFMILYGVGRIVTEFYRLPDADFANARPMGLSRGQWLSAALVAGGVGLLAYVIVRARKKLAAGESVPRFGGWLAPVFSSTKPGDAHGGGAAEGGKAQ
jgi:phosphatidylglycerol:prolipoprotein diacylglycerol transferase